MKALLLSLLSLAESGDGHKPPPPPLEVVRLLPSDACAAGQIKLAWKVRSEYLPGWHGHDIISWNVWFWDKVRAAHDRSRTEAERRETLRELVEWLGWEAVLSGRIPPAVPLELIPIGEPPGAAPRHNPLGSRCLR